MTKNESIFYRRLEKSRKSEVKIFKFRKFKMVNKKKVRFKKLSTTLNFRKPKFFTPRIWIQTPKKNTQKIFLQIIYPNFLFEIRFNK